MSLNSKDFSKTRIGREKNISLCGLEISMKGGESSDYNHNSERNQAQRWETIL